MRQLLIASLLAFAQLARAEIIDIDGYGAYWRKDSA